MNKFNIYEMIISTILLIIFMYLRDMILQNRVDSRSIVITGILFCLWYFTTKMATQFYAQPDQTQIGI